jgi:uncharacterized membrane protein
MNTTEQLDVLKRYGGIDVERGFIVVSVCLYRPTNNKAYMRCSDETGDYDTAVSLLYWRVYSKLSAICMI